jgi:hypothetical protein
MFVAHGGESNQCTASGYKQFGHGRKEIHYLSSFSTAIFA